MIEITKYFDRVWCVDFEYFTGTSGADAPHPICMVAKDCISGEVVRQWLWNGAPQKCPISLDDRSLYIAFYASAEINCHIALGWPNPERIIDLHAEFRQLCNGTDKWKIDSEKSGLKKHERFSLLACMVAFGLSIETVAADHKDEMRQLCMRGGPYSSSEQQAILDYCESDVTGLTRLLPRMWQHVELAPALFRGRYVKAVGAMERRGIPLDGDRFQTIKSHWDLIVDRLVESSRDGLDILGDKEVDAAKFERWLFEHSIRDWPRTPEGRLSTGARTLSDMSKLRPELMELKEFLATVRQTRLFESLAVGDDGRNRTLLSPFGSKTGRNTPSSSRNIFGPACWVRSLIQPGPGQALLYCDWSGQEYGEAAFFSQDENMIADYVKVDPYLGFGKRIGLVPTSATKQSHKRIRNQLKVAAGLGVLYGAQAATVARAGEMTLSQAEHVLREHRRIYPTFWRWRQRVIDHARLEGELRTCFGWRWIVGEEATTTSISNWMMQSHGAEMMRVACCLAIERGIEVCTPVHDALLVQAPIDAIDDVRRQTLSCMEEASSVVLGGPSLKVGVEDPVVYPGTFKEERGDKMREQLDQILSDIVQQSA